MHCYQQAVEIEPANAAAWAGLGADYAQIGDMEKCASAYARAVVLQPGLPGIHMSYAHVLKSLGHQQESLREYRAAIALKPEFGEAYWSMANLKVFRFEPAEVAAMEEQLKREDLSESADVHFRFALGKAYEDAGDYDRAWEYYHTGNQRQRPLVSHDPVGFEARHEEIAEVFSREFLRATRRPGIRVGRTDLHRGPAAIGLDADRADPREPQPGGGHARAATRSGKSPFRSGGTVAIAASIPRRSASCAAATFVPTVSSTSMTPGSTAQRGSRASPTSCQTTSRTSDSRT